MHGISNILRAVRLPLTLIGILIAGYSWLVVPNVLNTATLWLLVISLTMYLYQAVKRRRTWGTVETKSGPLAAGRIELYRKTNTGHELYTIAQTDKNGRYQLAPENGGYLMRVLDSKGNELTKFNVNVNDDEPQIRRKITL